MISHHRLTPGLKLPSTTIGELAAGVTRLALPCSGLSGSANASKSEILRSSSSADSVILSAILEPRAAVIPLRIRHSQANDVDVSASGSSDARRCR